MTDSYTDMAWRNGFKMGHKKGLKEAAPEWRLPEDLPEDGQYVIVSFANYPLTCMAEFHGNEEEGGAFYPVNDDNPFGGHGAIVEAWMPMPKPMHEEEQK